MNSTRFLSVFVLFSISLVLVDAQLGFWDLPGLSNLHDKSQSQQSDLEKMAESLQFVYDYFALGEVKTLGKSNFKTHRLSSPPPKRVAQRQVPTNESDLVVCGEVGVEVFNMEEQDTCNGKECVIFEADCNGTLYTNFTDYSGIVAVDCLATKLLCNEKLHVLSSQHQARNCTIEKFLCGNTVITDLTTVPNEYIQACFIEVVCDNFETYGFEGFGFYCTDPDLYCDGSLVQNIDLSSDFANCSVIQNQCDANVTANDTCYQMNVFCEGQTVDGGCTFRQWPLTCPVGQTQPNCVVTQLRCNGTLVELDSFTGPFDGCIVENARCDNATSFNVTSSFGSRCSIEELICDGELFDLANDVRTIDDCHLRKMNCQRSNGCDLYLAVCDTPYDCVLDYREFSCRSSATCERQMNVSSCVCPMDYIGNDCELFTPVTCTAELTYPPLQCDSRFYAENGDPNANILDGDVPCLIFALDESPELRYLIHCKFVTTPAEPDIQFDYFIDRDDFKVYKPIEWKSQFKIYNFNILSDSGQLQQGTLTQAQMEGIDPLVVSVSKLSDIPAQYWHGNRLYFEITWMADAKPSGLLTKIISRGFLDSPEYHSKGTEKDSSNYTSLIIGIVVAVVVVAIIVFVYIKNRRKSN